MSDSVFPLIIETGIGVDLTGDDATKAALRAVEDTIRRVLFPRMRDVLPDTILNRRKEGFSIPMKTWLRHELQPLMRELLSRDRVLRRGLFDPTVVEQLMNDHVAGKENHAHTLFPLMVFERWAAEHVR